MTALPAIIRARTENAYLSSLTESDLPDLAAFLARQSGKPRDFVERHVRWLLLENPARSSDQPLGFALQSSGGMAGCILCVPQIFRYGEQNVLLMGSSSFYIDEHYRGYGGRLFLQYSRLANRWPLFGTSANADAAALWKAVGAQPISHSDGELFGITNWPPVAEELAHRKTSNQFASLLAGTSVSKVAALFRPLKLTAEAPDALKQLSSAEEVCDLLPRHAPANLTALRDASYIRWRYFSGYDNSVALFASCRSDRTFLVAVNQRHRGYRNQIRTLNLLDVYPEPTADETSRIAASLIARFAKTIDALVLRNQNSENRQHFIKAGFHWRAFDAPTGWLVDRTNSLPGESRFVPADGDNLI